ncbi:MAG: hypothetical protein M3362_18560, partial [Acidobacteriota bacterium]|nr:hypothetical protein [Acidobacteriota bacterium]
PATILDHLFRRRNWLIFAVVVALLSVVPVTGLSLKILSGPALALPREYVPLCTTILTALAETACVILLIHLRADYEQRSRAQEVAELRSTEKVLFEDLELDVANLTEQEPNTYGR